MLPVLHPDGFQCTVMKRLETQFLRTLIRSLDWNAKAVALRRMQKPHVANCILKTWCNGWVTSDRMHKAERRTCVFGCDKHPDNIKHYVQCNRLWNPIFACLRIPPKEEVADRLALTSDEFQKLFAVAVAFVVYHSRRNTNSSNHD